MSSDQQLEKDTTVPGDRLEALNRAILETALDCIITMDATGRILEFNPAAERVFGFTRAEAISQELAELIIPPRMREQHRQGLARFLKTGVGPVIGKRIEIAGQRKDGSEILVELAITALEIDGSPVFTAYLRDITERRRDEEASRRLVAIVESSDDAIISKDLEGTITSWNAGAERLFGYKAQEVIGQSVVVLIPPERSNEEPDILDRIRRGEPVHHYETVRRRKDGTRFNISLTVSPVKDERGHIIGASKIARDITERVRNDRRRTAQYTVASLLAGSWTLEEASAAILQTIASIGDWVISALWIHDEKIGGLGFQSAWHPASEKLEKFAQVSRSVQFRSGEGLPGRVWESKKPTWIYDVTVDQNFPRAAAAVEAGLRGGFAFPLLAARDVNGIIELFSWDVVDPDPDLMQLVTALGSQIGLFIERRRVEQALQREKENAEAANAAKDRFLAMLSHELRTPLTPVLIWAGGTVDQPGLSPELQEGLKMVCRNVELEARLIDDLLDLTRLSRGKMQLQLRTADAHELLQQAIDIIVSDVQRKHLNLAVTLEARNHTVRVDAPRVQQVFWNVLRNACKFTPENGAISLRSANSKPGLITVEISDSGVGIAPEYLGKIFDAFEQIDARKEGLGLGLAISKAIVEMHGGTIRARSGGLGKGATFTIELPLADA
jgi:two-component system CheB/CheR fusion protein